MKARFSPLVQKEIIKIRQKNKKLFNKIEKQIILFEKTPRHPSLRTHKLSGSLKATWSISIATNFRMIYKLLDENTAYFVDMGTHDEVYGK